MSPGSREEKDRGAADRTPLFRPPAEWGLARKKPEKCPVVGKGLPRFRHPGATVSGMCRDCVAIVAVMIGKTVRERRGRDHDEPSGKSSCRAYQCPRRPCGQHRRHFGRRRCRYPVQGLRSRRYRHLHLEARPVSRAPVASLNARIRQQRKETGRSPEQAGLMRRRASGHDRRGALSRCRRDKAAFVFIRGGVVRGAKHTAAGAAHGTIRLGFRQPHMVFASTRDTIY